jgi:hypothetical protein
MKSVSAWLFCDLARRERRHDIDIVRLSQRGQSAKEQAATVSVECPILYSGGRYIRIEAPLYLFVFASVFSKNRTHFFDRYSRCAT